MSKNINHLNPRWREKIRAAAIIERMERFALGEKGPQGEVIKMTAAECKAATTLLAKVLPDLSSSDIVHHAPDERTYDEVRAEMLSKYGPDLASLLLGEITPGQYATRVFQKADAIQADTKPAEIQATEGTSPIQ